MDAKVASADMANQMMVWAEIGKPNQRERLAPPSGYAKNDGQYPSGYVLIGASTPFPLSASKANAPASAQPAKSISFKDRLWKGWMLRPRMRMLVRWRRGGLLSCSGIG